MREFTLKYSGRVLLSRRQPWDLGATLLIAPGEWTACQASRITTLTLAWVERTSLKRMPPIPKRAKAEHGAEADVLWAL